MKKLLLILGTTSTGKTDLALELAKKFNGELVACDSRQVYKGLDLGTGKMPSLESRIKNQESSVNKNNGFWIIDGVKIWMYDVANPKRQYDVSKYISKANQVIDQIEKQRKLPIIVGGTGLYIKGLLFGFSNIGITIDKKLRKELERLSLQDLQNKLQKLASEKWKLMNNSDRQNSRRLIRAIEIATQPKKRSKVEDLRINNFDMLKIGLSAPREILYKRIDERVIARINQGMIAEAEDLQIRGLSLKRMRQLGLEYGVLADFLEKKINKEELIKILQGKIHRFARHQITWFKREKDVRWFDITEKDLVDKVEKVVSKWYYSFDA